MTTDALHPQAPVAPMPTGLWGAIRDLASTGLLPRRRILGVMMITVLVVAFESVGLAMMLPLLDYIQSGGDIASLAEKSKVWLYILQVYGALNLEVSLLALCVTVFILIVLRQITAYVNLVWRTRLRHDVGQKMSVRLFRSVFESNAGYIQQFGGGSFAYLLATQVQAANALMNSFGQLWMIALTFLAYGSVILFIAPLTSVMAFGVVAVALAGIARYVRKSGQASRKLVHIGEMWTGFITERYRGWRLIKIGNALDRETDKAREFTGRVYRQSVGLAQIQGRIELIVTPFIILVVLAALYICVEYFSVSVGIITLFVVIVMRLTPVAKSLAKLRQSIAIQGANLDRVMRAFRETKEAAEIDEGTTVFDGKFSTITFDDVSYRYEGGKIPALNGISTQIRAGELTAIMGPSGSGKTTLTDLIPRLISPTSGRILMDQTPIESFTLKSLRNHIAYVSQEPLIFQGSVLDNIRYFQSEATLDEVEEACRIASADSFVRDMPDGYDSMLGDGGAGLSGGQRQRLALARAYLTRPSLLLLDEPTSALDYQSEHDVQLALEHLAKERGLTVIVIAHRLSTVRNADKLIVLSDGRIAESGRPDELAKAGRWYAEMLALGREAPVNSPEDELAATEDSQP